MSKRKILFVLTGHDRLGPADNESADPTGFHLSEAAKPWAILREAGFSIDFATPDGGSAPIDPSSKDIDDTDNARFLKDEAVKQYIENAPSLGTLDLSDYEAIYFPGGHGTMWDLPDSPAVQDAVRTMFESGKVVAAVCHGPAALVNVKLSNGRWLVDGRTVSAFTDDEERATGKDSVMPFLLARKLRERGAIIDSAENFEVAVSVDGRLVSGQNPASAPGVGKAILDLVAGRAVDAA